MILTQNHLGKLKLGHLKGSEKIFVCSSYTFLIEKLLTLPLFRLLITCEICKKCNYYSFMKYNPL